MVLIFDLKRPEVLGFLLTAGLGYIDEGLPSKEVRPKPSPAEAVLSACMEGTELLARALGILKVHLQSLCNDVERSWLVQNQCFQIQEISYLLMLTLLWW